MTGSSNRGQSRGSKTETAMFHERGVQISRRINIGQYKNYIFETGQYIFDRPLYKYQVDAVFHIMVHGKLLLGQRTGSGKSTVFHLAGILCRGAVLLIGPLLALMSDQTRKARSLRSPFGAVHTFNLDQIKTFQQVTETVSVLGSISKDTNDTYFLFCSPHTVQRWMTTLRHLISKKILRLIANDEYHFNSVYGFGFRLEVNALKSLLFGPYLKADRHNKLLFMSATNTVRTVGDITSILGVTMPSCYMMWGSASDFIRTDVKLRIFTFVQRKKHLSKALQE